MTKSLWMVFIWGIMIGPVKANNVRINGTVRVTDVTAGIATLEVDLSWENSWRDDFNWDAVWLFLKCKPVNGEWGHVILQDMPYSATNGFEVMNGKSGDKVVGVFVYPEAQGIYPAVSTKVTLKYNCGDTYTQESFDKKQVFLLAQGIEMVLIPRGTYYLGDNTSNECLKKRVTGAPLPECYDVIDNFSGYTYTVSPALISGTISNMAEHNSISEYPYSTVYFSNAKATGKIRIDFKQPKIIRYFGISAASNYCAGSQNCRPRTWYLKGSNDLSTWDVLYTGGYADWYATTTAYPVQNTLKIASPGSYRYYQIEMIGSYRSDGGIVLQSVAMTEKDLEMLNDACIIDSEKEIVLTTLQKSWQGTLPADYPKGYAGFYVMKYETSQEQYVAFLNTLTKTQQEALLGASYLTSLAPGRYVFGDSLQASYRNGIVLKSKPMGKPYVFDHDLNGNGVYREEEDGQYVACNYLSLSDMLAYASWCGLRPMSELEYERACRGPFPQRAIAGEYGWNRNDALNPVTSLTDAGTVTEVANGIANVNSGNRLDVLAGPLRCGAFARAASSQELSGATYWGVMEMSGNVQELVANVTHTTLKRTVNGEGAFNAAAWSTTFSQYGVRGGSFAGADTLLRISDRSKVTGYFTSVSQRDSTVGFRLVRTLEEGTVTVNPGSIELESSICEGKSVRIRETSPAEVNGEGQLALRYEWSVRIGQSTGDFQVIRGETGAEMEYHNFLPGYAYTFKRKAICALGEAEVLSNTVSVPLSTKIFKHSESQNAFCGLNLSVEAMGTSLTYQWEKDGRAIEGATSAAYVKSTTEPADAGEYRCRVTGTCGTLLSEASNVVLCKDGILIDPRDNQAYKTRILPDGREWMIENLRFGTCDASAFGTYYQGSVQNQIANGYWGVCMSNTLPEGGNLYNWQGAMNSESARYGSGIYPSGNVNGNNPDQWQGICPPGWHLPSSGSTGELQQLYSALCNQPSNIYPGTNAFEGVLGGCTSGASVSSVGSVAYYWSSTCYNTTLVYCLNFNSSTVASYTVSGVNRHNGFAVRCIKNY